MLSNHRHVKFIKSILKKPIKDRSETEQEQLAEHMMEIQYFKQKKGLKLDDFKELVNKLHFEKFDPL